MIILVTGSRTFENREFLFNSLDNLVIDVAPDTIEAVIHDNRQGAAKLADAWCLSRGVQPVRCPILFQHIDNAEPRHNHIMMKLGPDLIVAFLDEEKTSDIITIADIYKIEVLELRNL